MVNGIPPDVPDEVIDAFGRNLALVISERLKREKREPTLRMSNIGKPCERQLWYELNEPENGEEFRSETYLKFLYGDILEELLLFLAVLSGHTVEGRQDTQEIEGIQGHRDAVVDGVIIDVKSASTYSFQKFKNGTLKDDDAFGYSDQIQAYLFAGQNDPVVTDKERCAFLVMDKTLGHICLDIHKREDFPFDELMKHKKQVVAFETPPPRKFDPVPDGKSGNMKLGVNCSYCAFKDSCWPENRTFLYSTGPRHLVEVKREPDVPEIRRTKKET